MLLCQHISVTVVTTSGSFMCVYVFQCVSQRSNIERDVFNNVTWLHAWCQDNDGLNVQASVVMPLLARIFKCLFINGEFNTSYNDDDDVLHMYVQTCVCALDRSLLIEHPHASVSPH